MPKKPTAIESVMIPGARNATHLPMVTHERDVAIRDLKDIGIFSIEHAKGPYQFALSSAHGRLVIHITASDHSEHTLTLPLTPFKKLIKDYFLICESHIEATKLARADQIQTLDMARRGIHNEAAELLKSLLDSKATMDFNTARGIFTLICVLQIG